MHDIFANGIDPGNAVRREVLGVKPTRRSSCFAGQSRKRAAARADLGAGTGAFTRARAQPVGSDGHVIAIDGDARAVRSLRTLTVERVGAQAHLVLRDRDA